MTTTTFLSPDRKPPRFKPFKALACMQKLIADKEDTAQVFHIIDALNGRAAVRLLERFAQTPKGAARLAERRYLPPLLDDHDSLLALPDGSVGRAYVDFMRREGLTAQGLVEESEKFHTKRYGDTMEWFGHRLRDVHDMMHVLTGYGRNGLGEAALLAFTYGQEGGPGVNFIAYMGCRQVRKMTPRHIDAMACYHEGKRNGRAADMILQEDIIAMLEEPLEAARARLNIAPPTAYQRAIEQIEASPNGGELLATV